MILNENYNIVCNDIQYLEGIFEVLEIRKDIDVLIVSSDLLELENVDDFLDSVFSFKDSLEIFFIDEKGYFENVLSNKNEYKLIYNCEDTQFIKNIVEQNKFELEKNVKRKFLSKEAIIVKIQMIYTKFTLKVIEILLKIIKSRKEI